LDGPKEVDGLPVGSWRCTSAARGRAHPERIGQLEEWLRSYKPEELFDEHGALARTRNSRRAVNAA
jgi:xylulose-5-phosphate/fructose-6-phosphate phosphoketolase